MKSINRELLNGMSKAMLCSNYLEMDTFFHAVELVVEDEVRERQEHYKLGETTADMIQSSHKIPNDVEDTLRKFNVEL